MRFSRIFLITCYATAIVVFTAVLWWVPKCQVASLRNAKGVTAQDVFKAENDARATLAQIIGGFVVLVGVYFAWRNLTATTKNLELANKNFELATKDLELTKEGQVTNRFTKAVEQLGATDDKGEPKLELRLGGIYSLERIARDSERDHWPIMEILSAYVRENARYDHPEEWDPEKHYPALATDIAAILTVLRRREWRYEKRGQNLNLRWTDLRGADLADAYLEGMDLNNTQLWYANFKNTHLKGAHFYDAHLEGADLTNAHLEGADLRAHLTAASLTDAHMEGAYLHRAHLEGMILDNTHLGGAHLNSAHLEDTELFDVHLEGADLTNAHLEGADLTGALGLTQAQINSAMGDDTTKLPPGLVMPESWKKKPSS